MCELLREDDDKSEMAEDTGGHSGDRGGQIGFRSGPHLGMTASQGRKQTDQWILERQSEAHFEVWGKREVGTCPGSGRGRPTSIGQACGDMLAMRRQNCVFVLQLVAGSDLKQSMIATYDVDEMEDDVEVESPARSGSVRCHLGSSPRERVATIISIGFDFEVAPFVSSCVLNTVCCTCMSTIVVF